MKDIRKELLKSLTLSEFDKAKYYDLFVGCYLETKFDEECIDLFLQNLGMYDDEYNPKHLKK